MEFIIIRSSIIKILRGRISPQKVGRYLTVIGLWSLSLMLIAMALYPSGYTPFQATFSALGNPYKNPYPGWLFFSLALWSTGIFIMPFFVFIYKNFRKHSRYPSFFYLFFSFITVSGLILLGFFSESFRGINIHAPAALMILAGFIIGANISLIPIRRIKRKTNQKRAKRINILQFSMLVTFWTGMIGVGYTLLSAFYEIIPDPHFANLQLWEWFLFMSIAIYLFLLQMIISPGNNSL
ncbi:MAG: DUF998 domain-containing protein, partial [Candidatus Hodarchaeota archaeon]